MNAFISTLKSHGSLNAKLLAGPILIIIVLAMMVLPLPPIALDLFFTFNICLSIMVLLVAMFTKKPLDFAAFPSVLLFATLLRLSLNVASTRVVLLHGHTGPDAAGRVIESFGHFLVGGNFAVGVVVFVILVIINFMVITKGAGRIAEVGARFTLDAMPGKQMAIDADLNAGLIDEASARGRRLEVAQEAEFYGSMDGASKFVRGDAVAGLIIMFVSIIGGLIIGVAQHGLSFAEAGHVYTLLTIGDGLVSQIPALVISTAAGVVVSRVATEEDIGQQMMGQIFSDPKVLYITAAIIGIIGLIPNMPHLAFLTLSAILAAIGRSIQKRKREQGAQDILDEKAVKNEAHNASIEASWDDVAPVEPLALEVGYRLISMVDASQGGDLLRRISSLRKKFAQEMGFLPPVIHIRDNLELKPAEYRILRSGVQVGLASAQPGKFLAIDPGGATEALNLPETTDPTFGLRAYWVPDQDKDAAAVMGYTVVDANTVIATHIHQLLSQCAHQIFDRQSASQWLERAEKEAPKLTEDLVPKTLSLTALHKVLQGLLAEHVPINDMRTIITTLIEHSAIVTANPNAPIMQVVDDLLMMVRIALGAAITEQCFGPGKEVAAIGLDVQLERMLTQALLNAGAMEPNLAQNILNETARITQKHESEGHPAVLVVAPQLRAALSRFLRSHLSGISVLSNTEVPEDRLIKLVNLIGA